MIESLSLETNLHRIEGIAGDCAGDTGNKAKAEIQRHWCEKKERNVTTMKGTQRICEGKFSWCNARWIAEKNEKRNEEKQWIWRHTSFAFVLFVWQCVDRRRSGRARERRKEKEIEAYGRASSVPRARMAVFVLHDPSFCPYDVMRLIRSCYLYESLVCSVFMDMTNESRNKSSTRRKFLFSQQQESLPMFVLEKLLDFEKSPASLFVPHLMWKNDDDICLVTRVSTEWR